MPRRRLFALVAVVSSSLGVAPAPAVPRAEATGPVRDLGPLVGFRQHESSYSAAVGDANGDGWDDVLIVHHGSRPSELFVNQPAGDDETLGLEVAFRLVDTIHGRPDRHGCIMGDPNADGLVDFVCLKGANQGTTDKWNELWIQAPAGTWTDLAATWGVEDIYGRGRHPAWIDLNGDRYPDLFLGNDIPRRDDQTTPNRTYVNVGGDRFREVDLGVTREDGADCVQVVDIDGDGREDLLVCGQDRLFVWLRRGDGFVDATAGFGAPAVPRPLAARLVDLSGDGVLDLVTVGRDTAEVRLGLATGRLGPAVLTLAAPAGHGLAVGDVDGRRGQDLYIVRGCVRRVNQPDVLLLNGGDGRSWSRPALPPLPPGELAGCGDTAEMMDLDRDGAMEIVVLNGGGSSQPLDIDGPDQLLTMGSWEPLT